MTPQSIPRAMNLTEQIFGIEQIDIYVKLAFPFNPFPLNYLFIFSGNNIGPKGASKLGGNLSKMINLK